MNDASAVNDSSLFEILRSLEAETLTILASPPDIPVREVIVHDPTEEFTAGTGDVLLVVGVDLEALRAILEEAAARRVAAVVVRHTALEEQARAELAEVARGAGVGLLGLPTGTGWAEITSHLRAAVSASAGRPGLRTAELPEHDLVSFANALAEAVGGSVMIFNPQQDVLAASRLGPEDDPMRRRAALDQRGPLWYRERLRAKGVYQELWRGESVVEVDAMPDVGVSRRLAVAVRAGQENLGSIWVAEREPGFPPHAKGTLQRAVAPAARLLLRLRAQTQAQRFVEGMARQLLAGNADVSSVASWLDADPSLPCAVISCAFADASDGSERRLADLLTMHLVAFQNKAIPVTSRGRVDVLVCELEATDNADVVRIARDMVSRAGHTLHQPLIAAVGSLYPSLADAHRSRAEADLVLRVLRQRARDETQVAGIDDVRAATELLLIADMIAGRPELREGRVATLLAHDREHQTAYAETLAAYLDAFGDVLQAARAVNVHPNTLRYRLRRMTKLCGIDLTDPDERLMAALQLRVAALTSGSATWGTPERQDDRRPEDAASVPAPRTASPRTTSPRARASRTAARPAGTTTPSDAEDAAPRAAEREATEPDATEPDATEPDATEPGSTEST